MVHVRIVIGHCFLVVVGKEGPHISMDVMREQIACFLHK